MTGIAIRHPGPIRRFIWGLKGLFIKGKVVGEATKNTIFVRRGWQSDAGLITHERVHVEQMRRDGWLKFRILYFYYTLRYGYEKNPYEVEAYTAGRPKPYKK